MSEQHKPGETVKTSGIYKVVREGNGAASEVTCVEGEHFPPTRSGKGAHCPASWLASRVWVHSRPALSRAYLRIKH